MANGAGHYFYKHTSLLLPRISLVYSCTHLVIVLIFLSGTYCSGASLKSCKKVGYRSVIDEQGCDLVAVYVNKCGGYCLSLSFMNPLQQNELSVHAKCCRMIDVEMIDVELKCGNEIRVVKIPSAVECGCFDCA